MPMHVFTTLNFIMYKENLEREKKNASEEAARRADDERVKNEQDKREEEPQDVANMTMAEKLLHAKIERDRVELYNTGKIQVQTEVAANQNNVDNTGNKSPSQYDPDPRFAGSVNDSFSSMMEQIEDEM